MRIGDSTPIVPSSAAAPAAAPAKSAAKPTMASDKFFSSDPNAVNVVTFNTAGDNCLKTPEALDVYFRSTSEAGTNRREAEFMQ